ncbi:cupin domain-containing protein [Puteibacter caeruleilacunae]|nr:cupin domain-containing protein [Puteibacter caeruleilacunae]
MQGELYLRLLMEKNAQNRYLISYEMIDKRNFIELFDQIIDYWSPKVVGYLNDHCIKISKVKGEFLWHDHPSEEEMYYVVKGSMDLELETKTVVLNEGDFYIVPKGERHNPKAEEECWLVIFEKNEMN